VLLSFSGMGAVLGWQPRKPLVAPCDRPRVLDLWAQQLSQQQQQQQYEQDVLDSSNSSSAAQAAVANQQQQQAVVPIRQHYLPFAAIRLMSPDSFVQLLQQELGAAGVVAGINYRFGEQQQWQQCCCMKQLRVWLVGLQHQCQALQHMVFREYVSTGTSYGNIYNQDAVKQNPDIFMWLFAAAAAAAGAAAGYRAAGDSALLQQLCNAAGLATRVVELVGAAEPGAVGVVSSSKVSTASMPHSSSMCCATRMYMFC
jgi:hypothetical protein